jgi:hypothetical protein
LVKRYGYDTEFAIHALRLRIQGIEIMTSGHLTIPVPEPAGTMLRAVRGGERTLAEALELIQGT